MPITGPTATLEAGDTGTELRVVSSTATLPPPLRIHLAARAAGPVGGESDFSAEHIVVWGDTLFAIAARYGSTLSTLLELNALQNPDRLEVGQRLKLPGEPVDTTPGRRLLPDHLLYRSGSARDFDIAHFIASQPGRLRDLSSVIVSRGRAGETIETRYPAGQIIERVSLEYSVDPRLLLALLDYRAGLLSEPGGDDSLQLYPFISMENGAGINRAGLYAQLSWMADQLNYGFYSAKYRGRTTLEFADGSRLQFHPDLNPGSIALQHALAQFSDIETWRRDIGEAGFAASYRRYFGDPFAVSAPDAAAPLNQPQLQLPFRQGEIWRFTGGFHGGWGNGSAWSAIDFAPPFEEDRPYACFTSSVPLTAVARGIIARLDDGVVVLDLDMDGDEASGWTILYLHITRLDSLREGQVVNAGEALGYTSCLGGYSTATHLHIARRYNGEWIPADCPACADPPPPFVIGGWRVVGLPGQLYQGYLLHQTTNRSVLAEQGRDTNINAISW